MTKLLLCGECSSIGTELVPEGMSTANKVQVPGRLCLRPPAVGVVAVCLPDRVRWKGRTRVVTWARKGRIDSPPLSMHEVKDGVKPFNPHPFPEASRPPLDL